MNIKKALTILSIVGLMILGISFLFQEVTFLNAIVIDSAKVVEILEDKQENLSLINEVTYENYPIIYDEQDNHYYISVGESIRGNFTYNDSVVSVYYADICDEEYVLEMIKNNETFSFLIVKGDEYQWLECTLSSLPFVEITADVVPVEKVEGEVGYPATISVIDAEDAGTGRYTIKEQSITFKIRGDTTYFMDKKSYNVDIVDEDGNRAEDSFLGMREDDDWNLLAMYSDSSRVREKVVLDLMQELSENGEESYIHAQGIEFCELFINGEYQGIYGLIEQMDAKLVEMDDDTDQLYKYDSELGNYYLKSGSTDSDDSHYLDYRENLKYVDSIADAEALVDLNNAIDISLLKFVCALTDNSNKNRVLVNRYVNGEYIITEDLYDLNYSFGDYYLDDIVRLFNTTYYGGDLIVHSHIISLLLEGSDAQEMAQIYRQRYAVLRETVFSTENIKETINENMDRLENAGAYLREFEEWDRDIDPTYEREKLMQFVDDQMEMTDWYMWDLINK
ncbi:MAG: CotH kinase family protein [Erysipelotrichaceae bacterium]